MCPLARVRFSHQSPSRMLIPRVRPAGSMKREPGRRDAPMASHKDQGHQGRRKAAWKRVTWFARKAHGVVVSAGQLALTIAKLYDLVARFF